MRRVSPEEYKELVLGVMVKIDQICRENDIPYMLFFGSLLGAVRHKGFIPWDDDIDIVMMRKDYNRLAEIIDSGDYGINFIRIETCPDTMYAYGKVCDTRTSVVEKGFRPIKGYGAFVDIFPLDYFPNDRQAQLRLQRKTKNTARTIGHTARVSYVRSASRTLNFKRAVAFGLGKLLSTRRLVEKANREAIEWNATKTDYMGVGVGWEHIFPVAEITDLSEVEFEGHRFLAPKDTHAVLTRNFGDYMKLPPLEKQVPKHTIECYINE